MARSMKGPEEEEGQNGQPLSSFRLDSQNLKRFQECFLQYYLDFYGTLEVFCFFFYKRFLSFYL